MKLDASNMVWQSVHLTWAINAFPFWVRCLRLVTSVAKAVYMLAKSKLLLFVPTCSSIGFITFQRNTIANSLTVPIRLLLWLHQITITVAESKTKLQITKEYKWQLENDENPRKGNKLSENTYKRCVTWKLNGKKVRWLTKLNEKCDDVAANAKAKWI